MDQEAYDTLKDDLELNTKTIRAYQSVLDNPDEYQKIVEKNFNTTVATLEMGQSTLIIGELVRQFFNATHRQLGDEIIVLTDNDFNERLGAVVSQRLNEIATINLCTEEMAEIKIACDSTCDIAYI